MVRREPMEWAKTVFLLFIGASLVTGWSIPLLTNVGTAALLSRFREPTASPAIWAKTADSTRILELSTNLDPGNWNSFYYLGVSLYLDHRYDDTARAWQQAGDRGARRLEMLLTGQGDVFGEGCEIAYNARLSPLVLLICGQEYAQSGEYDRAIAVLQRAVELGEDRQHNPTLQSQILARLYLEIGKAHYWRADPDEAMRSLLMAEALASSADDVLKSSIWTFLGLTCRKQDDLRSSESYFLNAWDSTPGAFDVALPLAEVYADMQEWERAIVFNVAALSARPQDPRPYLGLSTAYRAIGKTQLADEYAFIGDSLLLEHAKSTHD